MKSALERNTLGPLKKIFGNQHDFGAILAANTNMLLVKYFGQKWKIGLVINVIIVFVHGQQKTMSFPYVLVLKNHIY